MRDLTSNAFLFASNRRDSCLTPILHSNSLILEASWTCLLRLPIPRYGAIEACERGVPLCQNCSQFGLDQNRFADRPMPLAGIKLQQSDRNFGATCKFLSSTEAGQHRSDGTKYNQHVEPGREILDVVKVVVEFL